MNKHSAAPGTPQTPNKAIWSTATTVGALFVGAWISDEDPFTLKEAAGAALGALAGGGVIGYGTYKVKNRAL